MPVHTVLGPVEPSALGVTSMHEHLFIDVRFFHDPVGVDLSPSSSVTLESAGELRWNWAGLTDNLVVDDPGLLAEELARFGRHGGSGIVDMTNVGLGRRVADLPALARGLRVHLMIGCGWYVDATHPADVRTATVDDLSRRLERELTQGVDGTGILPAIVGELGTSSPITPGERRVLLAAGAAAAATGSAVNVHVDPAGTRGLEVVETLMTTGLAVDRVVLSHMDERLDLGYHREVAATGAVLEYDTFGAEHHWGWPPERDPTDLQRVDALASLVADGLAPQLVLGCDVFIKSQHRRYGGMGYEHLPRRIAPLLSQRGQIPPEAIEQMLVHNPRRLLDRPTPPREVPSHE